MAATGNRRGAPSLESARRVLRVLRDAGHEAWLAGGSVRDRLLGEEPEDWDVATSATPDQVEALFRRTVAVGKAFGVIRVLLDGHDFEVATFRTESDYRDGRRPSEVTFATAEEDVKRRDFTVNGLLWDPFEDRVVDHVGGLTDLRERLVRAIGDPAARFEEDGLRLLRAVRFASLHDFRLEEGTRAALVQARDRLLVVARERVREELAKIAGHPASRRGAAWVLLVQTGLAPLVLPLDTGPEEAVFDGQVLDCLEQRAFPSFLAVVLRFAQPHGTPPAGWHELAGSVGRDLRCSAAEIRLLGDLLAGRACYRGLPGRSPARIRLAATRPGWELHEDLLRAEADAPHVLGLLRDTRARLGVERPAPLLDGNELVAAGVPRGPLIGRKLRRLRLLQLADRVRTRADACRALELDRP